MRWSSGEGAEASTLMHGATLLGKEETHVEDRESQYHLRERRRWAEACGLRVMRRSSLEPCGGHREVELYNKGVLMASRWRIYFVRRRSSSVFDLNSLLAQLDGSEEVTSLLI